MNRLLLICPRMGLLTSVHGRSTLTGPLLIASLIPALMLSLAQPSSASSLFPLVAQVSGGVRSESQPPEQSGQAQQMMKEARLELERAAHVLETSASKGVPDAARVAGEALHQFEQSLDQLQQSIPGYVPGELAASLREQVSHSLKLLDVERTAAATSMLELSLRVTDLTAEADLLIGRPLIGAHARELGNISNVLITADGRVRALVVDRLPPSSDRQFTVEWGTTSVHGTSLVTDLTVSDTDKLPDYVPN